MAVERVLSECPSRVIGRGLRSVFRGISEVIQTLSPSRPEFGAQRGNARR